jgi:hypothetical protein
LWFGNRLRIIRPDRHLPAKRNKAKESRKMAQPEFVAVKSKLSKGLFSSERAFEITLANGETYGSSGECVFCS